MPNWCFTSYRFEFPEPNQAQNFEAKINKWLKAMPLETDFGDSWLGSIVLGAGLDYKDHYCRGWVDDIDLNGNELTISTETAWGPMNEMWLAVFKKLDLNPKCFFISDESGCGLHVSNDPKIYGSYNLEFWDDGPTKEAYETLCGPSDDAIYEESEETVRKLLQMLLQSDLTDIQELLKSYYEEFDDCLIYEIEQCEFEEYE